ncbi:hypothetical protein FQN55_003063 [Onygenales sp. PD_40]|nr:hypothetical protein FQN55_003063 [Onygenales sp. PD_40]
MAVPEAQTNTPRHGRVLSFNSNKSEKTHKSRGSGQKIHYTESPKEKEANRIHTHADPTLAMNELQPSAIALQKSNLESLRSIQHKDVYGNPITDPDLSNPTRHRFERPLDTIRSFEAAIDGHYSNRGSSFNRPDESTYGGYSRRSSYFAGAESLSFLFITGPIRSIYSAVSAMGPPRLTPQTPLDRGGPSYQNRGYNEQANYSSNYRPSQSRPDSYAESHSGGYYNQYNNNNYYGNNGYPPRVPRHGAPRTNSDQQMHGHSNGQGYYPQQGQPYPPNDSYASGSGSASGNHSNDQLANYTGPSSVNSSMDRLQQQQQQQKQEEQKLQEAYGFNGFGGAPDLEYSQQPGNGYYQEESSNAFDNHPQNGDGYSSQAFAPPGVPPKDPRSGGLPSSPAITRKEAPAPPPPEKRKSWFKRLSNK